MITFASSRFVLVRTLRAATALAALAFVALAGCGKGCPDLGGSWKIAAHCNAMLVGQAVTISESSCAFSVGAPFEGFNGQVTADGALTLTGAAGTISCTGSATDSKITMNCTGPCAVTLTK